MKNLERLTGKAVRLAAFLFLFTGYPLTALAGIEISPVLLEMSEQQDKQVVRVGNSSETAKSFQVDVVAWSQSDEEREIYTPTDEPGQGSVSSRPLFALRQDRISALGGRRSERWRDGGASHRHCRNRRVCVVGASVTASGPSCSSP